MMINVLAITAKCEFIWVLFSSSATLLALTFEVEKSVSSMDVVTSRLAVGGKRSSVQGWW